MVGANWVAYLSGGHAAASTASAADHFWHIEIMRAFVKPRELLVSNKELARRFTELEARLDKKLTEHDQAIAAILSAIRELMNPPAPKRRPIGFTADLEAKS